MSTTIAFLGIGLMGAPMAARLAQAGHTVRAWNRNPAKAAAVPGVGACATLAEAVQGAALVISILSDGAAVAEVMPATLPDCQPGSLWVDMSSTRQDEALASAARLQAAGLRFIDAPVSGGVAGAQAGTLAIMAGGSEADVAEAAPVLAVLGRVTRVGPAGSGQVAKLCNQLIVGGTIGIVAEAMLLAQAAGADPAAVRAAIRGGFAESRILELHGQRMLDRNFVPGGQVKTQLKDQNNVLAAARDAGLSLPISAMMAERYRALAQQHPTADHAALLLELEARNPGRRVGAAPDKFD
ncbi:NAD(P)-dependent oxidoreductase [Massilia sp. TS11]|uniref:NAD(P)-dependent oxidoreductase n=1 Tax=Massilia sp. TS11 TaxID=2908003 RepID=UPI001EDB7314|nr:NAD(P)-dependent oxidoreductase [Massilia sp. TS11]MCG2586879.1 NAD(P)-dependent oxidoreductase [Massilia sp. TS11]